MLANSKATTRSFIIGIILIFPLGVKLIKNNENKKIYTFIGDKGLSPYLSLCIKTWRKNIPEDYEIVKLNSKNLSDYIPNNILPDPTRASSSFSHFFDYIASAVLFCNGGIFLSPEVIMTQSFYSSGLLDESLLEKTDLVLFGREKGREICKGFMMANKGSKILKYFLESKDNISLSELLRGTSEGHVISLDAEDSGYLMELAMYGVFSEYIYQRYYFTNIGSTKDFFKASRGITYLNSAWTDEKYNKMSENEFLKQDILLSKIFKSIIVD